jgi:succinyl-diaminopimelate desuccinylase
MWALFIMTTKEIINHTKKLIAIPSTADNPAALQEAVDFLTNIIAERCPEVTIEHFKRNDKPSILAYAGKKRPTEFDILVNCHVDVVPASPELFTAKIKDGRMYGRGALDMKGTAVVLVDAFCNLINKVDYPLGLQIVSDEEIGGFDGAALQIEKGLCAKFVLIGEYSNHKSTIYNAARGICWAEIAFKGKTAHGGHPWNGSNAVVKAGEFAGALLKRYPTPDKETWTTTASIANLSTPNQTFNAVPEHATLKVDFRFTQEDPDFQTREAVEAMIKSVDPDAQLVELAVFEPAVNVEQLNPYVQGLSAALKQTTGVKTKYLGRPAGSDGRLFVKINSDIVEYGLYGQNSHSQEEYVELSSFDDYRTVINTFLKNPLPEQKSALSKQHKPKPNTDYVWYATYGSGLSIEDFMCYLQGGQLDGTNKVYPGCTDKTPPLKDVFISLPHKLSFAGVSHTYGGGGWGRVSLQSDPSAHTISRAYLITTKQLEELVAQNNEQPLDLRLPLKKAIANGHAQFNAHKGNYNIIMYCGQKDGYPMFTLTGPEPSENLAPPSIAYTRCLYKGLTEHAKMKPKEAVKYLMSAPGIEKNYKAREFSAMFKESPTKR